MEIVQAVTPGQVAEARALFREYERSLGIDLCFQGFEQELASLPGAYARRVGGSCSPRTAAPSPAAWRCDRSTTPRAR